MTAGLAAMLLGIFVVPAALLWAGHHLRRRSPRIQGAFWGGLVGHVVAVAAGLAAMFPAAEWADGDALRGALGFWSWLVLPAVGAAVGLARGRG